jgi:hypothetical protein
LNINYDLWQRKEIVMPVPKRKRKGRGSIKLTCTICGDTYYRSPSESKKPTYCSKPCAYKSMILLTDDELREAHWRFCERGWTIDYLVKHYGISETALYKNWTRLELEPKRNKWVRKEHG